jgi:glycosyl transferase family 87
MGDSKGKFQLNGLASTLSTILSSTALVFILWIFALRHCWGVLKSFHTSFSPCDFCVYYSSALALRKNLNPYATDIRLIGSSVGLPGGGIPHATDPPTYLLLFTPLTFLSPHFAFITWQGINFAALLLSLFLLLAPLHKIKSSAAWSLGALAFLYPPLDAHFYSSQNKLLLLLILTLMMRCMTTGREKVAGSLLALSVLLRVFPIFLTPYFVIERRYRILLSFSIWLIIGAAATACLLGTAITASFFGAAQYTTERIWIDLEGNASVLSFVSRIFWHSPYSGPRLELLRQFAVIVSWLIIVGITMLATLSSDTGLVDDPGPRAFSLWIVASIMLSPIGFPYYLVLLYIPFSQLAYAAARGTASQRSIYMGIASYLLSRNPSLLGQAFVLLGAPGLTASTTLTVPFFPLLAAYVSTFWLTIDRMGRDISQIPC